jgi:hypothetical protein
MSRSRGRSLWPNSSIAKRDRFGEFPRRILGPDDWLDRCDNRAKPKRPGEPDNPAGFPPVNRAVKLPL